MCCFKHHTVFVRVAVDTLITFKHHAVFIRVAVDTSIIFQALYVYLLLMEFMMVGR